MARPKKRTKAQQVRQLTDQLWKAVEQNDWKKADELVDRLLALNPANATAWYGRALIRSVEGDLEEAYRLLHKALEYNPRLVEAWSLLAQIADALGYTLEAQETIRHALELAHKQKREPELIAGLEAIERGLTQAVKRLSEDFRIPVDNEEDRERLRRAYALYAAGIEALDEEDVDKAVDNFRQLVDIAPSFPRGWGNLGLALLLQERLDEAEAALKRALEIDPDYEPARLNLKALNKLRKGEKGIRAFLHKATSLKRDAPRRKELR